ncbi:ATP-binding cassette domain-containing protein [Pseudomonas sp. NPDC087598]|uniref:ATP-binding cassette domain-containing protein n=1 Tax=Pseudomonas sp. NPDC087598 TaxID=3364440 RepID=UPI00380C59CE
MRVLIRTACKKHRLLLVTTITAIISLKLLALAPPLLLGAIVDSLSSANHTTLNTLLFFTAAFTLAGCVQAVITPLQTLLLSRLVQRIVLNASISWMAELMGKEFCQFSNWRIGHFIKSVERGITAHEQLLTFFVTIGFPLSLEFVIVAVAFWYMGGTWIFFAMASLGVVYLFATHRIISWRRKHIDAVNEQEDELSAILFNTLKAGKAIKLEQTEHTALQPLNGAFNQYAEAAVNVAASGGLLSGAKVLFISLSTGGLLSWGVVDQLSGSATISVGQLVAIFSIAGTFLLNISALTEGYRVLDQFLADQRRLQQLLKTPDFDCEDREWELPQHDESTLRLAPCVITDKDAVRLSIVDRIDFKQRQSVAITGPSGAGKSTLLEALAGLNTSVRNQLTIDDLPVARLSARVHLQELRYCPQSPQFLEGSFDKSVLFGAAPSPDLSQAIQRLKLEEITGKRHISENAGNISGGEAKRLSLLRLINRPGKFNLFDEPSASIEPQLATPVWDLLFETFAGRGLICVTHDVSHLHRFDRVIVMQDGEIIEDGPWHDLLDKATVKLLLSDLQTVEQ